MKLTVQYLSLTVCAYLAAGAEYLRHRSDSAAKAISLDQPTHAPASQPSIGTENKAVGTQLLNEQKQLVANECMDKDPRCAGWASAGECAKNPAYMLANCELSCGACNAGSVSGKSHPLGTTDIEHGDDSSKITIDAKHPHAVLKNGSHESIFWGNKNYVRALLAYIPYAILVCICAFIWMHLGGRIPPTAERNTKGGRAFEYGLCDTDHIFNHHMWMCVCAFCCCPIRMADTYSKEGKTKPIVKGFWVALALTLFMGFLVDLSCGLGIILFLGMAVYFRQKIRETYGLPRGMHTIGVDCLSWCFCPWCTAAQEARQVECADIYGGSLGSSGILRR